MEMELSQVTLETLLPTPASNPKLPTSVYSQEVLGARERRRTLVKPELWSKAFQH